MTNKRCLLHKTKLEAFKAWLDEQSIPHRPGKGPWQELQVLTEKYGWQVVFSRAEMPEHLSMNEKLTPLVRQFIEETRKCPKNRTG